MLCCALGAGLALASARAAATPDAPFAWEVQGAHAKHYLLGSVHLLPQTLEQLPSGLDDLYDAADAVVFETDLGAIQQPQVQGVLLQAGKSEKGLKAEVGAPMYARLQKRLQTLGVETGVCDSLKAWFCSVALELLAYQKAGFSGDNGLDEQVYSSAQADNKDIRWFEAPAVHLGLFADMSETLSRQMLESSLDERGGNPDDEPEQLFKAWHDDDFASVEKITADLKRAYPALYERLLAGRNRNWMPKLKQWLDGSTPTLVVVGAAHFAGPDGLLAALRARGYRVRPYVALPQAQIEVRARRPARPPARLQPVALPGATARR